MASDQTGRASPKGWLVLRSGKIRLHQLIELGPLDRGEEKHSKQLAIHVESSIKCQVSIPFFPALSDTPLVVRDSQFQGASLGSLEG